MRRHSYNRVSTRSRLLFLAIAESLIIALAFFAPATPADAASRTWDGGGDGTRFHDPLNWDGDALPGNATSTATNTTNSDVATFGAAEATTLDVQIDTYRRLGRLRFVGPGNVRLFGFSNALPIVNDTTGPTGSTSAFNINGADGTDTIRVEAGNVVLEGTDEAAASILMGRFNNNLFVEVGSTLTFDATMGFINTSATLTKTGGGTIIYKGASGNTGGNGGSGANGPHQTWTIADGKIRVESPVSWRGGNTSPVTVLNGAMLELVNASYAANNSAAHNPFSGLKLNGSGVGGLGALYASGGGVSLVPTGTSTVSGANPTSFLLETDTTIGVETGSTLTISDDITDPLNPISNPFGSISGLTKVGGGTLILTSAAGYHGATVVSEGTLLINTSRGNVKSVASATFNGTLTSIVLDGSASGTTDGLSLGQPVNGAGPTSIVSAFNTTTTVQVVGDVIPNVGDGLGGAGTATFDAVQNGLYYFNDTESAKLVTVQSGATLGGSGMIRNTQVNVASGGALAPGASIGAFDVGGADVDGTLKIEFGGNKIDRLNVVGTLDITNTTLDFNGIGTITSGEYIFATYDTLQGSNFAGITNLPAAFTLHHDTVNKYFSVMVTGTILNADHNADGIVDAADYAWWRKYENSPAGYDLWRAHFDNPPGSGSALDSAGSVPEPACSALAALVLIASLGSRYRPGSSAKVECTRRSGCA